MPLKLEKTKHFDRSKTGVRMEKGVVGTWYKFRDENAHKVSYLTIYKDGTKVYTIYGDDITTTAWYPKKNMYRITLATSNGDRTVYYLPDGDVILMRPESDEGKLIKPNGTTYNMRIVDRRNPRDPENLHSIFAFSESLQHSTNPEGILNDYNDYQVVSDMPEPLPYHYNVVKFKMLRKEMVSKLNEVAKAVKQSKLSKLLKSNVVVSDTTTPDKIGENLQLLRDVTSNIEADYLSHHLNQTRHEEAMAAERNSDVATAHHEPPSYMSALIGDDNSDADGLEDVGHFPPQYDDISLHGRWHPDYDITSQELHDYFQRLGLYDRADRAERFGGDFEDPYQAVAETPAASDVDRQPHNVTWQEVTPEPSLERQSATLHPPVIPAAVAAASHTTEIPDLPTLWDSDDDEYESSDTGVEHSVPYDPEQLTQEELDRLNIHDRL